MVNIIIIFNTLHKTFLVFNKLSMQFLTKKSKFYVILMRFHSIKNEI